MAIVQSFGALQSLTVPPPLWSSGSSGSVSLYGHRQSYAEIYKTQPNVRICVDFLSRNIAQLALHAFRRVSDTDRVRLHDHDLIAWYGHPNPATGAYRLTESLMADMGIYFNAYWLKIRYRSTATGRDAIGLVRLPPDQMNVEGGLLPQRFLWTVGGQERPFPTSEIVHFDGFNPFNSLMGLSPLETLYLILAEEQAAGEHRESYWRNASRHDGIIERPIAAPKWTPDQKRSWREQWQERFAGAANGGRVPVLEDGMTFKATSFSPKDSEYILGGKLRREICAAAYMIPQPMVGILDHATFSNIKEQHKHLYQDTLGPWLEMIVQGLARQLLVECDDQRDVYLEYNIAAKLAGSFEEQATSLQMLVGRPLMSANEGRARLNLPRAKDPTADDIAQQQGGPAAPKGDTGGDAPAPTPRKAITNDADADAAAAADPVLRAARSRQRDRLVKFPAIARASEFYADSARWQRELTADLVPIAGAAAETLALQAVVDTFLELAGGTV